MVNLAENIAISQKSWSGLYDQLTLHTRYKYVKAGKREDERKREEAEQKKKEAERVQKAKDEMAKAGQSLQENEDTLMEENKVVT